MEIIDFDFGVFVIALAVAAGIIFVLLRRVVYGILDPWIWIPINQTLMLGYVFYEFWSGRLDASECIYWCAALAFFAIGLQLANHRGDMRPPAWWVPSENFTSALVVLLSVYQMIADLIFVSARGVPSELTPDLYGGGFGIVKYIHDANTIVLGIAAILMFTLYKKRPVALLGIFALLYPMMFLEWGKAGVLNLLLMFFAIRYFLSFRVQFRDKMLLPLFTAIFVFMLYKFSIVADAGYADSALQSFVKRAINSADSVYFYFVLDAKAGFEQPLSLPSYLLSHVLPYFGVIDPLAQNLGVLIPEYATGFSSEEGYGPSPPFQIIGHLALGNSGVLYALTVGLVLGYLRRAEASRFNFVVFMILYSVAPFLAGDASLFAYYLMSIVSIVPAIFLAALITTAVSVDPTTALFVKIRRTGRYAGDDGVLRANQDNRALNGSSAPTAS